MMTIKPFIKITTDKPQIILSCFFEQFGKLSKLSPAGNQKKETTQN